jgi:hypothetical protein
MQLPSRPGAAQQHFPGHRTAPAADRYVRDQTITLIEASGVL